MSVSKQFQNCTHELTAAGTTCVRHVQEQANQSHSREEGRAQEVLPLSEKLMATGSCCRNYKIFRRTLRRTWVQVFFFHEVHDEIP